MIYLVRKKTRKMINILYIVIATVIAFYLLGAFNKHSNKTSCGCS